MTDEKEWAMGLTVTEKEHWGRRLKDRIQKKIDRLEKAGLKDRVESQAMLLAVRDLGLETEEKEASELKAKIEMLQEKLALVRAGERQKLGIDPSTWSGRGHEVQQHLLNASIPYRAIVMADDPDGQEVLRLKREQEGLLDAVFLATSPKNIRELWDGLGVILQDSDTEMQERALKTAPGEGE